MRDDGDIPAEAPVRPPPIPKGWTLEEFERRTRPGRRCRRVFAAGYDGSFCQGQIDALRNAHLPTTRGGGSNGGTL